MTLYIDAPPLVLASDKKDVRKVLKQGGNLVAKMARELIANSTGGPGSAPQNKTGTLSASIKARVNPSATGVTIIATGRSDSFYALALEHGRKESTRQGGIHKKQKGKDRLGRQTNVMQPHPFLSTALEELPDDFGQEIADAILAGISLKKRKR